MKKRVLVGIVLLIGVLFSFMPVVLADSVEDEIQRLTHYAEEYEAGNIDYVRLMVYSGSIREKLNEELGAVSREHGGIIKKEQIRRILGEPTEETKWVWVPKLEHERKLLEPVPVWRKIVFDGKKINIMLEAFPMIFIEKDSDFEEEKVVYNLHFNIQFKKPEDQINIQSKINKVKSLAEIFNSDSSQKNGEVLAKESVNAERAFENSYRESGGECVNLMDSIFGSEFKRETQKLLVQEINFYDGDNFEAIVRLEMCDDCEWNWINLDLRIEGRGPGFKHPNDLRENDRERKNFEKMTDEEFKSEIRKIFDEIKSSLETGNIDSAMSYKNKLWGLNEAWNKKSNDLWDEVKEEVNFNSEKAVDDPYFWIKEDQKQRQRVKKLRLKKFEDKKRFYSELFSGYRRKEYYFEQQEWEKRLIQEFRKQGKEICDNNQDDNDNEQIDCGDDQCVGQICGKETIIKGEGEEAKEKTVDLYCVQKQCQQKEEIIEDKGPVCGNHICEDGENKLVVDNSEGEVNGDSREDIYCPQDCVQCLEYEPIECDNGKVIFSGNDENGCLLEPICVEEKSCATDNDCEYRCGVGKCAFDDGAETGKCELVELKKCEEKICNDGEKAIEHCNDGDELVTAICADGLWVDLNIECSGGVKEIECEKCGEGCVKKDDMTALDCGKPTQEFDCVVQNDECVMANLKEENGLNCEKCGNNCVSGEEITTMMCEESTENFDCFEENGECVTFKEKEVIKKIKKEEVIGNECEVQNDCGNKNDVCSNGKCVTIPEVIEESEEEINIQLSPEEIEELDRKYEEGLGGGEESITGNIIFQLFNSFLGLLQPRITGFAVDENGVEILEPEISKEEPVLKSPPEDSGEKCPEIQEPDYDREHCSIEEIYDDGGCLVGYSVPVCDDKGRDDREEEGNKREERHDGDELEERDRGERERHEEEQKKRCENECMRMSGVENCIRDECGEDMDCDIDEERKKCEKQYKPDENCISKCMKGGDWWKEFENIDEHKEERGVYGVMGSCRKSQGRTEPNIHFFGWGDPFEEVEKYKRKYYEREGDWCKWDLKNSIKQRREIEKGFNQDFAVWFFEDYLANSGENMMGATSGLFEMYWRVVDNSRMMAERMQCLGKNDITEIYEPKLISFEYKTEYGSVEYWEELKEMEMPWMKGEKVKIVSPYMRVWIFPTKKFIKYEFKNSMKKHEFPGPPEEKMKIKNEGFPTEEDIRIIKGDRKIMNMIKKLSEEYGGELKAVLQVVDFENDDVVFNVYAKINEEDIITVTPMLVEEISDYDVKAEIDFNKVFDMIMYEEKNMRGAQIESPPWDRRRIEPAKKVNEFVKGIKMFFKARAMINSMKVTPAKNEDKIKDFLINMMKTIGKGKDDRGGPPEGFEELSGDEKKELMKEFGKGIFDRGERGSGGFDEGSKGKFRKEKGGLFGFFKGKGDEEGFREGGKDGKIGDERDGRFNEHDDFDRR